MAQLFSDADVGLGPAAPSGQQPTLLSDADVGLSAPAQQPQSFTDKVANLWEHPPAGPSIIGAARSLYDAVMTPGRTMQAAEDQANKTQISDSDIPLSTGTLMAPAANMAANIILPAPGMGAAMKALPAAKPAQEAPAYGVNSVQRKAADIVSAPLKERGLATSQDVENTLSGIGPEAVLADADPRLMQMAGTVAAKPGPGQQILRDALEARNAAAGDRVTATTDQVMGKPVDLGAVSDAIHNAAKDAVSPLYADAYKTPITSTPELEQALSTPLGKLALSRAKVLAQSDTGTPPSAMFGGQPQVAASQLPDWAQSVLAKGGEGADRLKSALQQSGVVPAAQQSSVDVRGLHLTRQALDDMIRASQRSGANNKSRILNGLRGTIDSHLKQVEPFAQADQIYADKSRIQEAMAEGLNIFKNNRTPEDVSGLVNGMSEAEKEAYRQAARVAVRNAMGTARNDAAAARGLFSKEFNQEKLAAVLGKGEADKLLGRVSAEKAYANTDQRVLRNSETAARAYGKDALEEAHGFPDVTSTINYSGLHAIPRHLALRGINKVLNAAKAGRQQAIETEVAKLLSLGRSDLSEILPSLLREGARRDPTGRLNAAIIPFVLEHAVAEKRSQTPAQ